MTDADGRPRGAGGVALVERRAELAAEPTSPRAARRLLHEALAEAGRERWQDAAELALTELVTNAVLHAHTAIHLRVAIDDDRLFVEVGDDNPSLPVLRSYDVEASTGRGLTLVARLASACGIERRGANGKVIWFTVGDGGDDSVANDGASWTVVPDEGLEPTPPTVVLQHMPATLWLSACQHHDALLRELALYATEHDAVVDFAAADHARHHISDTVSDAVDEAHREGRTRPVLPPGHPSSLPWVPEDLDLELTVDPAEGNAFLLLQDGLDLAERLAVSEELLVLPGLPEIVAVRDWACDQVVAQLAGIPPAPWRGADDERFETETHGRAPVDVADWDASIVRDSPRGVVAADDANRILAISRRLAAALGWDPADLVGRRVVTLIPPALREAHVAGFSRHLTTGEAHVLGVELELPVLHADGREIPCAFLIERAEAGARRTVYLAWIEPIAGRDEAPVSRGL